LSNKQIQTIEIVKNALINYSSYKTKQEINPDLISNVFDILKDSCETLQDRSFGVIVYIILKYANLKWEYIATVLDN
jgi:hypothetical protein